MPKVERSVPQERTKSVTLRDRDSVSPNGQVMFIVQGGNFKPAR